MDIKTRSQDGPLSSPATVSPHSSWVIGRGGLLGSAIEQQCSIYKGAAFSPTLLFSWSDPYLLRTQIANAVSAFAQHVEGTGSWQLHWAAGRGVPSSTDIDLSSETAVLTLLLKALDEQPTLRAKPGILTFASSAGGIYAGSTDEVINEESEPAPRASYGREKLKQEGLLKHWAADKTNTSVILARFSTLYGPGQSQAKRQGLLTHIARCILQRQPIHIFVPLDTIRDYLYAQDAAAELLRVCRMIPASRERIVTKIIGSEHSTTIAQIISIFRRVTRTLPRVVTSCNALGAQYPHRQCFRSIVFPNAESPQQTSLLVGIARVFAHEQLTRAIDVRR